MTPIQTPKKARIPMNESNGTEVSETTAAPKLMDKLHAEFKSRKQPVTAQEASKLVKAWQTAHKATKDAEAALMAAKEAEQATAIAIVKARGKGRFKLPNGDVVTPMSKGENVWLAIMGGTDLGTFG
jgi:hypothetical protein